MTDPIWGKAMQEALLLKKRVVSGGGGLNSIQPYWGWNYSTNTSTGTITPTGHTAGSPVALPISLAGYTQAMKGLDTINYATGSRSSTADYTVMMRVLLTSASNYVTFLSSGMTIRTGDSGFGWRLQMGYAMSTIATCWDTNITTTNLASAWYHITMQRKAGVNTVYINGTLVQLANGTGSTYNNPSFSDNTSVINYNSMTIGQSGMNLYTAEWGFWNSAIVTANFTPPAGGLI